MSTRFTTSFLIRMLFYLAVIIATAIGWFSNNADLTLTTGYVLLALGIFLVLVFSIYGIIDSPRKSLLSLIGFLVLVLIFIISYSTASTEPFANIDVSTTYLKLVGASLSTLYVVGGLTIVIIFVFEIYSFFK